MGYMPKIFNYVERIMRIHTNDPMEGSMDGNFKYVSHGNFFRDVEEPWKDCIIIDSFPLKSLLNKIMVHF